MELRGDQLKASGRVVPSSAPVVGAGNDMVPLALGTAALGWTPLCKTSPSEILPAWGFLRSCISQQSLRSDVDVLGEKEGSYCSNTTRTFWRCGVKEEKKFKSSSDRSANLGFFPGNSFRRSKSFL